MITNIQKWMTDYWNVVAKQDRTALRSYFHSDAIIRWQNTKEQFTLDEFITANCEYPGKWGGQIERMEFFPDSMVTAVHIYSLDSEISCHVVSFFKIVDDRISVLDEYWGDDGDVPEWRKVKQNGKMGAKEARERMDSGRLYDPGDEAILREQVSCLELLYDFNQTRPGEMKRRMELMKQMFAEIGENCYLEPPFHANFGGKHVHMGNNVYANFNLTLVDDAEIYIGDGCMFGPNVTVATAGHPIDGELRSQGLQFNMPVHIGRNVWIGAGAVILPGVTVADNVVIGAGSVVTKDIPSGVVAVGNPCRVLREIGERDKEFYYKDRRVDL